MAGLVVKSAVRSKLGKMRASGDFFKALDNCVACCVTEAINRAKANGRKTCKGCDV